MTPRRCPGPRAKHAWWEKDCGRYVTCGGGVERATGRCCCSTASPQTRRLLAKASKSTTQRLAIRNGSSWGGQWHSARQRRAPATRRVPIFMGVEVAVPAEPCRVEFSGSAQEAPEARRPSTKTVRAGIVQRAMRAAVRVSVKVSDNREECRWIWLDVHGRWSQLGRRFVPGPQWAAVP